MENTEATWKVFSIYLLIVLFVMWAGTVSAQIVVTEFNAEWNNANQVEWLVKLSDCDIAKVDITKEIKMQQKHKIVIVPTIIIFKDGEEIKSLQREKNYKILLMNR